MSEQISRESTRAGVVGLLSEVGGSPVERIKDENNLYDLGLDSLDIADLDIHMEERYGFNLEDLYDSTSESGLPAPGVLMPVEARTTVGQIVDYVHKRLSKNPAPAAA